MCKERVRQIETRAQIKLRKFADFEALAHLELRTGRKIMTTKKESARQSSRTRGTGRGPAADESPPKVALLSNGSYGVMITDAGSGVSTWRDLDVTRWREDATRDCWGQFVYVRCPQDGKIWSIGKQPMPRGVDEYQVAFHADMAEFRRRDGNVETSWAVCVARDNDAEVRLVTLVNHDIRACELDLTSYAEVCLNNRRADQGHPAFAKLFLETAFVPGPDALLARRRPRATDEKPVWAIHVTATDGPTGGGLEYETDRARFLGAAARPPTPPPWTPRHACQGLLARCLTRYSVCGGESVSSRKAESVSRSLPASQTPVKQPPPWRSISRRLNPLSALRRRSGQLPARVVGAGVDRG